MDYQNYHHQNPTTDLFTDEPLVKATFGTRFAAAFIDGIILLIPNLIFTYMFPVALGNVLALALPWLYSAGMESSSRQATLGKSIMEIKVVNTQGQPVSFAQATGRHFGKYLSMIILFIGYLMMLWDENKQTLHDKMAGAFVVRK